jgi:endonuclease/exonuclease/phosphatase family metal-dependent hydrolase
VRVRVLTWNLKHGRSVPGSGRDLFAEFSSALAGWEWDVALLQEVPPWWPPLLVHELGVDGRHVLTSRNSLMPLRRALATRWPDVIKSNGGGSNAILVQRGSIDWHRTRRLSLLPERRWMHAIGVGHVCVANLHTDASPRQARLAAATAARWAGRSEMILGGDFNLHLLSLDGFRWAGGYGVDHVYARGTGRPASETRVLDGGHLSDHAPVLVTVTPPAPLSSRIP